MARTALLLALVALACGTTNEVSRTIGARCADQDECEDRCLTGTDYPDGFCSLTCDDDGDCPGSAICVGREGGVCLFACDTAEDCEFLGSGWSCAAEVPKPQNAEVMVCVGSS